MINTDPQKIETILTRGVERLFPNEDFLRSRLLSGEQLTLYMGIDPTGPTLHLGHIIPLMKLSQFQELGHRVILVIGDFTAQIGDPDKTQVRKQLTHEEVLENAQRYKDQASTIISFEGENPAEIRYNSEWLGTMDFADVISVASHMTVQRMLDRDMFRRRMKEGNPIYIHEFMYPLMQGYDSVVLDIDGEVGGNDQTFNMLVGRDFLKDMKGGKEKFVVPMKLLVDSNGEKMGKTTGNMLSLLDSAEEQFKKIMRWTDDMILLAFELLTHKNLDDISARISQGENPRDIKFDLACAIVSRFYGESTAKEAQETWLHEVSEHNRPDNILEIENKETLLETLATQIDESKSQLRRLFKEGAIKINEEKVFKEDISVHSGDIIQIGKKQWYRIK